jgi:tryptophan 2,3-dioxygenase
MDTVNINKKCRNCMEREYREPMNTWQSKTIDEKLLDIHKRLLKLESNNKITH